jgi:phosphopantothenoylcysteine decarboxylase/phosphopantothenate--cysteine ligase
MGYAIAEELARQGAKVSLVSGPVKILTDHQGIEVIKVVSALEMYEECTRLFPLADGAVMAAAVADFMPDSSSGQKIKRGDAGLQVTLVPTKDIAANLGRMKTEKQILVGFALETNDELSNAARKLQKKNLDFIVLNSLNDPGAGFETDTNKITIIDKYNNRQDFQLKSKAEVAEDIVSKIVELMGKKI